MTALIKRANISQKYRMTQGNLILYGNDHLLSQKRYQIRSYRLLRFHDSKSVASYIDRLNARIHINRIISTDEDPNLTY